jgi:hypothetical protein
MALRITTIALSLALLFCGCSTRQKPVADDDWRYSDLRLAIDAHRKKEKLPERIRSVGIEKPDVMSVYLSDYGALSGFGCELTLTRIAPSEWRVTASRFFDQ